MERVTPERLKEMLAAGEIYGKVSLARGLALHRNASFDEVCNVLEKVTAAEAALDEEHEYDAGRNETDRMD